MVALSVIVCLSGNSLVALLMDGYPYTPNVCNLIDAFSYGWRTLYLKE